MIAVFSTIALHFSSSPACSPVCVWAQIEPSEDEPPGGDATADATAAAAAAALTRDDRGGPACLNFFAFSFSACGGSFLCCCRRSGRAPRRNAQVCSSVVLILLAVPAARTGVRSDFGNVRWLVENAAVRAWGAWRGARKCGGRIWRLCFSLSWCWRLSLPACIRMRMDGDQAGESAPIRRGRRRRHGRVCLRCAMCRGLSNESTTRGSRRTNGPLL